MQYSSENSEKPQHPLKRLCYVVMAFPHVSETFIVEEAQSLKSFGIDMILIALNKGNFEVVHPSAQALLDQDQVRYVTGTTKLKLLGTLLQLLLKKPRSAFNTLLKALTHQRRWLYFQVLPYATELIENKTDYIHAHFADDNLLFAVTLSEWTSIPFGFTMHGYDLREDSIPISELSTLANQASAIATVSEYNKRFMVEKYHLKPAQIYVAFNGIWTEKFQPSHKITDHPALHLLNVGRLVPIKGQDILLEALYRVRQQGFSVQLQIIGDGPLHSDLKAHAQRLNLVDYVVFLGSQSQEVVRQCLNEADMLIMPSRSESFGVACIEAMAMELPVIASDAEGLPEVVINNKTGLLFQSENPESLAEAIIWMIQHPEQRLAMGKQGRETVLAKFTREKVTAGLINYWQNSI